MFRRLFNGIFRRSNAKAPKASAGKFARPISPKTAESQRNRKDRRERSLAVSYDRRSVDRRAEHGQSTEFFAPQVPVVPVTAIAEAIDEVFLKTGTDNTVVSFTSTVVPFVNTRRHEGVAISHAQHAQAATVVGRPAAGPSGVGQPSARVHAGQQTTVPEIETIEEVEQEGPYQSKHGVSSISELENLLGSRWRGHLHGVVAEGLSEQCILLDMRCGQVVALLTQRASEHAHWSVVKKKIETEWCYTVSDVFVITEKLASEVYLNLLDAAEREHTEPLTANNCYLRFYDDIAEAAIAAKASDVHLDTFADEGQVRLRVYGRVRRWLTPNPNLILNCIGAAFGKRLKPGSASRESFSVTNGISFMTTQSVNSSQWDGRVTGHTRTNGYKLTMRLLESNTRAADIPTFKQLGMNASQQKMFAAALSRQWGLIITFGGTGQGKSTTLRSMLVYLPGAQDLIIVTVESPAEYLIPGAVQVEVPIDVTMKREEIALIFVGVLRTQMRMDPDVLMVSEIRDHETASLAIEFTATDHRCFTTAHGQGSIDGLQRMTGDELRIAADTLAGSKLINAALFQKLLPMLCEECKLPATHPVHGISRAKRETLLTKFQLDPAMMFVARPDGCKFCRPSVPGLLALGTKGVCVALEIFMPTLDMLPLIAAKEWAKVETMWRRTRTASFSQPDMQGKTAFEHGLLLLAEGKISLFDLEGVFESIESYRVVDIH